MSDTVELKIPANEAHPELLSLHSLFSFSQYDSGSRLVMAGSHFSQHLVVGGANEKRIQTGAEQEIGKYTFSVKMPVDGTILKVISRYPAGLGSENIAFSPETLVIYEDAMTKEIGCFSIENFTSQHQYFGYKNKFSQAMQSLVPGSNIPKGTKFADSPAIGPNGEYMYGVDMNVALMSHPAVSEDGILISKSALKKLSFKLFERRVLEFGTNAFPLNVYGTKDNYKPFPDIGDYIREDGILAITRNYDIATMPVDMGVIDTMEPDYTFDNKLYTRAGKGRVIDIAVYKKDDEGNTPTGMTDQPDRYARGLVRYYKEIFDAYTTLKSEHKRKFNENNLKLKPEFLRLLVEAQAILNKPIVKGNQTLHKLFRKAPLDEYRVEFVIEYEITPTIGYKGTDSHGGLDTM